MPETKSQTPDIGTSAPDSLCNFVLPDEVGGVDGQRDFTPDVFTPPCSNPSSGSASMESSVPAWLAQELQDADFIPMPTPSPKVCDKSMLPPLQVHNVLPGTTVAPNLKGADLRLYIPSNELENIALLNARIVRLEEENQELKRTVAEQARTIHNLQQQLS
ncbi:unnamed protein product [Lymnaea stagnalis]|uniref:Uncharacterized protein n=1 Tax=Lymnaea stagnalis TaxID=6523 RepID=A0AAV2IAR2_LYMST